MKNRKIAAIILFAIAAISLSFTFSGKSAKASKSVDKSNMQVSAPQEGFVSESRL